MLYLRGQLSHLASQREIHLFQIKWHTLRKKIAHKNRTKKLHKKIAQKILAQSVL
jgi:hypothetical protein